MRLAWQQIPSPVISELLCQNSLDGVVIDTEHGAYNIETLFSCIQVITLCKKKCFVRLTETNKTMIRVCLDAGASGLIFSTVESDAQSKEIKKTCNYPNFGGSRGLGLVRENLWGKKNLASTKPILIAQIETLKGIENIKEISSNNFDYYMIGPYDLSASLGHPGDFNSNLFLDSLEKIKNQISENKMAVHIPSRVKEELKKYKNYGIIALGMDTTFLIEKYQEVEEYA